jgi:hypothetical protein
MEEIEMRDIIGMCEELKKYEEIVIVGPDFSKQDKLRVYANGGLFGRIYLGDDPNKKTELMSETYAKNHDKSGTLERIIKEAQGKEDATLVKKEYVEAGINATEKKFGKKETNDHGEKERHVETRIVKNDMNTDKPWSVVDMEVKFPKEWFQNNSFHEKTTKQPRFDLVVLNEDGFGIIELKVNNESCDNMRSHYDHMSYILESQTSSEKICAELGRRIEILKKHELVSPETFKMYERMKEKDKTPLWCGFLFVGGTLEKSKKIAKRLEREKNINSIRFMYYDDLGVPDLNINNMMPYEKFMKQE